jgi:hypothetical protein
VKQLMRQQSERNMRRRFPLDDLVPGWFFRVDEVTVGQYIVEGKDLWGRGTSLQGPDPEPLLQECV